MLQQTINQSKQLNQQMIAALQLLPLSIQELHQQIREISEINPFLKVKEKSLSNDYFLHSIASPINELLDDLTLQTLPLKEKDKQLITFFIQHLDHHGFIPTFCIEILKEKGYSNIEINHAIELFQNFEPAGCGARSLQESLLIQVKQRFSKHSLTYSLINQHFDLFLHQENEKLCKILSCTLEDLKNCKEELSQLNPYPLRGIHDRKESTVLPDCIIEYKEGIFRVRLTQDELFELSLDEQELSLYQAVEDSKTLTYIKEKKEQVEQLLHSLELRKHSLVRLVSWIVEHQTKFFLKQEKHLVRYTFKEAADQLEMHESTIGRIVKDKYIVTPSGIFLISHFFSHKGKGEFTDLFIKEKIKYLISIEDRSAPKTDERLKEELEKWDISISRRTVALYRKELGILNLNKRRNKTI